MELTFHRIVLLLNLGLALNLTVPEHAVII